MASPQLLTRQQVCFGLFAGVLVGCMLAPQHHQLLVTASSISGGTVHLNVFGI